MSTFFILCYFTTSSMIIRKLGTLNQLILEHGPTKEDVVTWAKNEVKLETEKYKKESKTVLIPFHADRPLTYDKQVLHKGGCLFYSLSIMEYR